jgi:single-strand DNA-binding protein
MEAGRLSRHECRPGSIVIAFSAAESPQQIQRNRFTATDGGTMSDSITLTGVVATAPRSITTQEGLAITSFRMASPQRRFDRSQEKWIDGDTNWYTITTFRQLAANAAVCVKKGERVVVTGRLRIREWESGDKTGTNIDVEADALGHDLSWGTSAFSRSVSTSSIESIRNDADDTSTANAQSAEPEQFPTSAELVENSTELVTPF